MTNSLRDAAKASGSCAVPDCPLASVYTTENGPRCWGHRNVENPKEMTE